jgi:hypothetical protein
MINTRTSLFFLILLALSMPIFGQTAGTSGASAAGSGKFLPLTEVREGMKGTAMTVFRGSEPEEFEVEILGVLPGGVGPKQDLIIGRIGGGAANRTAVFAGMSGSPVYVNGKLIGAISYSFPFSKEAICGITPIEQMISIFEERPRSTTENREPVPVSFAEIASATYEMRLPQQLPTSSPVVAAGSGSMLQAVAGQSFRRIGTPLTFTGIAQSTLDLFAPQLMQAGLIPVAAAGGSAKITPMKKADANTLKGGASVSMMLTRGDYSLAAAGTVTMRDGDKVYAFGHPFLSLGTSDLPMSESSVITVVPSVSNSFKLAVPEAMVGTMTQDRATGVFGTLGRAPRMIPVKLNVETSRGQQESIEYEIAQDDFLTPLLLNITVYNAIVAQERSIGDSTVMIDGAINITGQQPIKLNRRFGGQQASMMAAGSVATPVNLLLRGRFDDLDIDSIELTLRSVDGSKAAELDRIAVDRVQVKAGETVNLQAFARTASGRTFVQPIEIKIPAGTPAGKLTINVGDGGAIQKTDAIQQFVPNGLSDLVTMINRTKLPDRLYVKLLRETKGVIIGASEMPNLPPSMLATMSSDRVSGGTKPAKHSVVAEQELTPAEFVITGERKLEIEVID